MTLHIIMLTALIIGGIACAWWLHRAHQERRKRQIYELAEEARQGVWTEEDIEQAKRQAEKWSKLF